MKVAQDTEQKSVQIVCFSYEDPNVDDMKPSSNNRDGSEDSGGCSTSAVLDREVDVPVVDGVRISVSEHSDSKVYIGKIVCVAGNEIDREVSTTHDGMLASSSSRMS